MPASRGGGLEKKKNQCGKGWSGEEGKADEELLTYFTGLSKWAKEVVGEGL